MNSPLDEHSRGRIIRKESPRLASIGALLVEEDTKGEVVEVEADQIHATSDHDQDLHGWSKGDKFTAVAIALRSIDASRQPREKQ